jgi:hypothetical protein
MSQPEMSDVERLRRDCDRLRQERDQYRTDLEILKSETDQRKAEQTAALKEAVGRDIKQDVLSWCKKQGALIGLLVTIATAGGAIKLWDVMSTSIDKQVSESVTKAVESHRSTLKSLDDDAERLRSRVLDSLVEFKDQARKTLSEIDAEKARVVEHGQKTREEITSKLAEYVSATIATSQGTVKVSVKAPAGTSNEVIFGIVPKNTVVISSTAADQAAADSAGSSPMGLFSYHFQQVLQDKGTDLNNDGMISWDETVIATQSAMKDAKQTPVIAGAKVNVSLFAAGEDSTAAKAYDSVRAILVGINQYKSGFNLKGAVNDVRGFAQLLGEKNRVLAKETAITL